MKKTSHFLTSLAAISMLLPAFLSADEERVPVGERVEQSISEDFDSEEAGEISENIRSGFLDEYYPPVYYPASCHWMMKVSALGDSLEIEDGSVWEINSSDGYKALHWKMRDPLIITQNRRWFSSYDYKIQNKTTGSTVDVNLKLGPFENGQYTNYIAIMDRRKGELALTDSSNWEICPRDRSLFRNWKENQAIIIGVNTSWESSYDILLINVNTNNYVRAKQF